VYNGGVLDVFYQVLSVDLVEMMDFVLMDEFMFVSDLFLDLGFLNVLDDVFMDDGLFVDYWFLVLNDVFMYNILFNNLGHDGLNLMRVQDAFSSLLNSGSGFFYSSEILGYFGASIKLLDGGNNTLYSLGNGGGHHWSLNGLLLEASLLHTT
jgi:hypothetical protein